MPAKRPTSDEAGRSIVALTSLHDDVQAIWRQCISPAVFWSPEHIVPSAWLEHAPFMFWLIEVLRPKTFVELGVQGGFSYFAVCQAVQRLQLETRCYAVDTWKGDEHAGFYDEGNFLGVFKKNEQSYSSFSTLVRSTFDEAAPHFQNGSIDLLHIDGRHFYDDVRHDFDLWREKLSDGAVALFHDINVRERGFGVFRLWDELRASSPHFEFLHGHGLGVVGVGKDLPDRIRTLFSARSNAEATNQIRQSFSRLGSAVTFQFGSERLRLALMDETAQRDRMLVERDAQLASLKQTISERDTKIGTFWGTLADRSTKLAALDRALSQSNVEIGALRGVLADRDAKLTALEQTLAARNVDIGRVQEAAANRDARLAALEQTISERDSEVGALEEALARRDAKLAALEQEIAERNGEIGTLRGALAGRNGKLAVLEQTLAKIYAAKSWRFAAPFRFLTTWRDERVVARSGLFDPKWYLDANPDVVKAGIDPVRHYMRVGAREGRNPSPLFDGAWYLEQYPDVRSAGGNPLAHYLRHGIREGRRPRR